jgi:hypothetical protein
MGTYFVHLYAPVACEEFLHAYVQYAVYCLADPSPSVERSPLKGIARGLNLLYTFEFVRQLADIR